MQRDSTLSSHLESIPVRNGIIVLGGYEIVVSVEHGRLTVVDGLPEHRRKEVFTKATCGLKRLVIVRHSGTISLDSLRWLHDIRAGIVQIDADGQLLFASSSWKETYSKLRRAQGLAGTNGKALEITKRLLSDKLIGQARIALAISGHEAERRILEFRDQLEGVKSDRDARVIESQAAAAYWGAWSDVPIGFARQD